MVEELRIVSNDSAVATSLTSIAAGMMLEDGRFVTVHSREGVLRIFDAAGRLIRLVGGKGDGPGEFRGPNGFGTFDSTIWVRDILAQRYVLFNHRFEPLGSLRLPRTQAGVLVLGVGVGQVGVFLDQADTTALYVHDAGGETTRRFDMPLRSVAHRFSVRDAQSQGGSRVTQSPLGSYSTAMLIPGGTEVLLLEPSLVWGGRAGQISLRRLSLATGQLSDRTIVSLVPQPVSRSERDSVVADWIEVQKYSPAVLRASFAPEQELRSSFPSSVQRDLLAPDTCCCRITRLRVNIPSFRLTGIP